VAEPLFLLDANICIYLLAGRSAAAVRRVEGCEQGLLVTSVIAYAEVMLGAYRLNAVSQARAFFRAIPVLPFDAGSGDCYAALPFRRARFDRLIAGQALQHDLTVVTGNVDDFADIPGLKVENWTLPL